MRREFKSILYNAVKNDDKIWVLTAELGYKFLDDIRKDFPDRFVNVGTAEQALITTAIGLAESGKIPICYSITPFLLFQPAAFIRNYLNHENIPVKLLGAGRDKDYEHDNISHWAEDDKAFLSLFPNIVGKWPDTIQEAEVDFYEILYNNKPSYLNIRR